MYTGCRRGELCALRWSDFTYTENGLLLTVSRSRSSVPGKGIEEGTPKNGKSREIYLSSDLPSSVRLVQCAESAPRKSTALFASLQNGSNARNRRGRSCSDFKGGSVGFSSRLSEEHDFIAIFVELTYVVFYAGEAKETSPAIAIIFGIYAHLVGIFLLRNGKRGGNRKNIGDKNVKKFSGGKEAYYKMNGTRTLS